MKLGVFAAAFFIAALLGVSARAQASPFCPADVVFMTPWDFAADAPAQGDSSSHYAYRLEDTGTDVLSGHVTLASDTQTYSVAFQNVHFTDAGRPASDPDPLGDEFQADGAFVTLPAAAAVRYAWVADVTDSSGAVTHCPIFPYKVPALTAQERSRMTGAAPPNGVHVMYRDAQASLAAPLAAPGCPQPYRDAAPDGEPSTYTKFFDPSITSKPVVEGAAAVDESGNAIAAAVLKSSGSQVYDNAAKEEYGQQKYRPALFDCRPVPGIYYFSVEYYWQK